MCQCVKTYNTFPTLLEVMNSTQIHHWKLYQYKCHNHAILTGCKICWLSMAVIRNTFDCDIASLPLKEKQREQREKLLSTNDILFLVNSLHATSKQYLFNSKPIHSPEFRPAGLLENLRFREGFHGLAQGTVFMVKLQVEEVKRGKRGVTSVSHLPILLRMTEETKPRFKSTVWC